MVSGGDVLLKVSVSGAMAEKLSGSETGAARDILILKRNGEDITTSLQPNEEGSSFIALVSELENGLNTLTVNGVGEFSDTEQTLEVTNYPITGPIFSGPHENPFYCGTDRSGLGKELDTDCSVAPTITYYYQNLDGRFLPLPSTSSYPEDVATTKVYGGTEVPYVVRIESGTINRGIYRIAILDDPTTRKNANDAWKPGAGWNGKLVYRFGGGCGSGKRQSTLGITGALNEVALQRGFAVATTTLNTYGTACNDYLSAETAMMVKEYFSEQYGVPRYTVGEGGSGGAMQQHLIAQNYPGILDGLTPERSFPDGQTLTATSVDSILLAEYFRNSNLNWTDDEILAVSGFQLIGTLMNQWGRGPADRNSVWPQVCSSDIPGGAEYDRINNPTGVRCTIFDSMATVYGKDANGFGQWALDMEGVQYGLNALKEGKISIDKFIDLNEKIGGVDLHGTWPTKQRIIANEEAVRQGYKTGRVIDGKGITLPIIDLRQYQDYGNGNGNVHTRFHSFAMRQRLIDANGTADNQVMWIVDNSDLSLANGLAMDEMDKWLEALKLDTSEDSYATKVIKNKPTSLTDGCWHPITKERIDEPATFDKAGTCNTLYRYDGHPRTVAGEGIRTDSVKCSLKPVSASDYGVAVTSDQLAKLKEIFSTGVCDYSKEGMYREEFSGPWQSFGPSPGGVN